MKNIHLRLFLSSILILPIHAYANSWSGENSTYRYATSTSDSSYIAELDQNIGYQFRVFFTHIKSDECSEFSEYIDEAGVWYINKQAVKMNKQCIDENIITYFANSDKGAAYIINQFQQSEIVIAEGLEFSAVGFLKAYRELNTPLNKPI